MKSKKDELEFDVMPAPGNLGPGKIFDGQPPKQTPKLRYWLIFGIVVLLGVLSYLVYAKYFAQTPEDAKVPDITVNRPAGNADSDKDGLTDAEETRFATNPAKADTDGDGLADGDEVNIYGSDPLLYDTDSDTFDDGREIARGFSPLTDSKGAAQAAELKKWADGITKFGLHEPTPTTLKLKAAASEAESGTTYENKKFGYAIAIPTVLAVREGTEGRSVGVYVKDTIPDPDIDFDPITLTAAVKVAGQTLQEWVATQYPPGDESRIFSEIEVNSLKGQQIRGIIGEECAANKTFFAKGESVFIITLRCNDLASFVELYDQIVQSFKFQ